MPTSPTLRDRIAEALISWTYRGKEPNPEAGILETVRANAYSRADAVLTVLPAPVDYDTEIRAAAFREGADAIALDRDSTLPSGGKGAYRRAMNRAEGLLRRMADETAATDTQAATPANRQAFVHNAITEALSAAGDWVPLSVRAAATRAALAEVDAWHAADPAAGARQDEA